MTNMVDASSSTVFENPYFDRDSLNLLEKKVNNNKISAKEIESLDLFLSGYGFKNFIITKFKEQGLSSYEDYIEVMTLDEDYQEKTAKSILKGIVLGSIGALKEIIDLG